MLPNCTAVATRFLNVDNQICQKTCSLCISCLRRSGITSASVEVQSSFYAAFKAKEMPSPVTSYSNIFSIVMFPRSASLTFLKMHYFNFGGKI